jgi:hypothetical protein
MIFREMKRSIVWDIINRTASCFLPTYRLPYSGIPDSIVRFGTYIFRLVVHASEIAPEAVMRSIRNFFSVAVFSALAASCAPTTPTAMDTTTLVSGSKTIALTKVDSAKTTGVSMTCGCPFPVFIDGEGGDFSTIKISFVENMNDTITTHTLKGSFMPTGLAAGSSYSAWVALHSIHHAASGPILLRDTVFFTAVVQ